MIILRFTLIELLIKGVPEGFLDVLAIYLLTKTVFDKKKYLLLSLAFIVSTFIIRNVTDNVPVNTMLSLLILIIFFVTICKAPPFTVIKSTLFMAITLIICETLNGAVLVLIFGQDTAKAFFDHAVSRSISGIPSTLFFALAIVIYYLIVKKINKNKKAEYGEISEKTGE
jgi:hypothetical protein